MCEKNLVEKFNRQIGWKLSEQIRWTNLAEHWVKNVGGKIRLKMWVEKLGEKNCWKSMGWKNGLKNWVEELVEKLGGQIRQKIRWTNGVELGKQIVWKN